jgi:hypothetical protein
VGVPEGGPRRSSMGPMERAKEKTVDPGRDSFPGVEGMARREDAPAAVWTRWGLRLVVTIRSSGLFGRQGTDQCHT